MSNAMTSPAARSPEILENFLATNPGALRAAEALRSGAEVALRFGDVEGDWRLRRVDNGSLVLESQAAEDPDFKLDLPAKAVDAICGSGAQDLGDLGVSFFEHIVSKDPERRILSSFDSGVVKLTRRGWVGLLAQGGPKVMKWMAAKGLRGPGSIAAALGRLKGR